MSRKGPIKVIIPAGEEKESPSLGDTQETLDLPPGLVLSAGLAKFMEYATLHWPAARTPGGEFKLVGFDFRNPYHLKVTLGMVYRAMRKAEDDSH